MIKLRTTPPQAIFSDSSFTSETPGNTRKCHLEKLTLRYFISSSQGCQASSHRVDSLGRSPAFSFGKSLGCDSQAPWCWFAGTYVFKQIPREIWSRCSTAPVWRNTKAGKVLLAWVSHRSRRLRRYLGPLTHAVDYPRIQEQILCSEKLTSANPAWWGCFYPERTVMVSVTRIKNKVLLSFSKNCSAYFMSSVYVIVHHSWDTVGVR